MAPSSRRQFLRRCTALAGGLALPGSLWTPRQAPLRADPVEVVGRVTADGSGVPDVALSDGRSVVATASDGSFSLTTTRQQPFVWMSVPSGYRIPQHDTGTARFYRRLPASGDTAEMTFALTPLDTSDEQHAFLVLADPQTETTAEMQQFHDETVPCVQNTVADLGNRPVFGVGCGDIMYDDLSLFPEYERAVQRMDVPFWQVVGNHDLDFDAPTDAGSTKTFQQHFGPRYYSFDRGAVHYVVLDNVFWPGSDGFGSDTDDYVGYIDAVQLTWLQQDLARVAPGRPVVVLMHIPALSTAYTRTDRETPGTRGQVKNRDALYALLDPFDAHVIAGHVHENTHRFDGGRHEHVVGTVCGAWWSGPICYDGTPSGYAVYEVDGTDIRWRYQSTGQPADDQMRVYPMGSDPTAPDEIVANIWDADPAWTVVWYEDGIRKGEMARRTGTDPLSEDLHRGPDKPSKRSWVDPLRTDHLYYAPASDEATDIHVEATDRFGRTYVGQMVEQME